tara:strand:+ start:565 stop:678 length:114 start_codon:yes stop_codon:yes gene_type:complete
MDKQDKTKFNEKEFWKKRTKTYLEETKSINKWLKKDN